jgi:geranylgeranyl diphosphate synthase type II
LPAMDDDDFRRGRPTNHKVYGEGLAVLAGDGLALLAPDVILGLRSRLPPERVLALTSALLEASGARGVIAGQAAEMSLESAKSSGDSGALFEVFRLKTGALFRASLTLPAIAAGVDGALILTLGKIGDDLGIAFQIADDLEDDFAAKKSDPAHVAAFLTPETARSEAERRLNLANTLPQKLRENLSSFIEELRKKISGGAV